MEALLRVWRRLIDGFWFVPALVALALTSLALLLLEVDRRLDLDGVTFGFGGDADAARDVLSTIAGSLITVAGLTFSITIVVLTLVSNQYTPRAIRSLLADRLNQTVAGAFVGIFAYCLVVLGAVRSESAPFEFVPVVSVSAALVLALIALALLVVFVHHMGENIQSTNIAARIGHETLETLDRLYPDSFAEPAGRSAAELVSTWREEGEPGYVASTEAGYVQKIDLDGLPMRLTNGETRVHVATRAGSFVTPRTRLIEVWPREALGDGLDPRLRGLFVIESERDLRQDADYGLRRLTDVALRALSPGINDPTTALDALAYSVAALERIASRSFPDEVRELDGGRVVVAAERAEFKDYLDTALGEVAHYASANTRVVQAVLGGLRKVAGVAHEVGANDRVTDVCALARDVAAHARNSSRTARGRRLIDDALDAVDPVPR